jgi:hypothetical protein
VNCPSFWGLYALLRTFLYSTYSSFIMKK